MVEPHVGVRLADQEVAALPGAGEAQLGQDLVQHGPFAGVQALQDKTLPGFRIRVGLGQGGAGGIQGRLGLLAGGAILEPGGNQEGRHAAAGEKTGRQVLALLAHGGQGGPEILALTQFQPLEAGRSHTHHRIERVGPAQGHGGPDHRRVALEGGAPQAMAQDHHQGSGALFLGQEGPSQAGAQAEQLEPAGTHQGVHDREPSFAQVQFRGGSRHRFHHGRKGPRVGLQILKSGVGGKPGSMFAPGLDFHHAKGLAIGDGQLAEQHGLENGMERHIGPQPQAEHHDDGHGEARAAQERPQALAKVQEQVWHGCAPKGCPGPWLLMINLFFSGRAQGVGYGSQR